MAYCPSTFPDTEKAQQDPHIPWINKIFVVLSAFIACIELFDYLTKQCVCPIGVFFQAWMRYFIRTNVPDSTHQDIFWEHHEAIKLIQSGSRVFFLWVRNATILIKSKNK